jgi:hypothetical protein
MHLPFSRTTTVGLVAAVSVGLGSLASSGLLSASADDSSSTASTYEYTGLFDSSSRKSASELQASDAAFVAKAASDDPHYGLVPDSATLVPATVDGVRAFAVRSSKGTACLVTKLTTSSGALGGGYGIACPSEGDGSIDFISPGGSFGIVPDTVTTLNYTLGNGRIQSSKPSGNVWQAPTGATRVSYAENGSLHDIPLMSTADLPKGTSYNGGGMISGDDISSARTP